MLASRASSSASFFVSVKTILLPLRPANASVGRLVSWSVAVGQLGQLVVGEGGWVLV
jgi:hypothetical protein